MHNKEEYVDVLTSLITHKYDADINIVSDQISGGLIIKPQHKILNVDTGTVLGIIDLMYPPIDEITVSRRGDIEILTVPIFDLTEVLYSTLDERILNYVENMSAMLKRLRGLDEHAADIVEEVLEIAKRARESFKVDAKPTVSSDLTLKLSVRIPSYVVRYHLKDKRETRQYLDHLLTFLTATVIKAQKISRLGRKRKERID